MQYRAMFSRVESPLQNTPVLHGCGHFHVTLLRREDYDMSAGYIVTDGACTVCNPCGRNVVKFFDTLADAQRAC